MSVTTKTLTPTNQTVTLPGMDERPNVSVLTDGIGKEADAINALSDQIANLLLVENVSPSSAISVDAGTFDVHYSVAKTGYTILGVVGWSIENRDRADVIHISAIRIVNSDMYFYGKNTFSSAINLTPIAAVLYKKN